uniref:Cyclin G1 n=1 Tax=Vombatus ursinus TaxID=29139 RepID=A0A4X2KJL3_VOMUR
MKIEKTVLEKFCWKVKTAFQFLQLYYSFIHENLPSEKRKNLSFERLEAQLKTCYCRIMFSKAKPSVLALSIIVLTSQAQKFIELTEGVECLQKHSKINCRDLTFWQKLVAMCLTEYSSNKCSKPNVQKLKWIVSGHIAHQLKHSYYKIFQQSLKLSLNRILMLCPSKAIYTNANTLELLNKDYCWHETGALV